MTDALGAPAAGLAPTNDSPTPATASAIAMRAALRRKNVVRLLIVPGV